MLSAAVVYERVPATATLASEVVDAMVASAQAFLEQQTGRYFGIPVAVTEMLFGTGGFYLFLPDKLQTGTPTVTERAYPGAPSTVITGFEIRQTKAATQLARTDGSLWKQGYEYAVAYTRGYLIDTGPADLLQLVLDLIALRVNLAGQEGVQSASIGAYSFTRVTEDDLTAIPGALATLARWRRPVFA